MAIPKFLEDLLIISKLGDNPGSDNGLSSSGLRAKFDEAGVKIQQYINNTLIPALSELADPTAGLNMKGNISMGGHRVTGLGEPVENGDAVPLGYARKIGNPHNLLDNSDFRNPVNQRGFASGTLGMGECAIDRWWLQHFTALHLESDCIGISSLWSLNQRVGCKLRSGKTYTFAVKARGETGTESLHIAFVFNNNEAASQRFYNIGTAWNVYLIHYTPSVDYAIGTINLGIGINTGNEQTTKTLVEWAALYEGEYTAETLPEYQPKGYGVELAECLRYYQVLPFKLMTATSEAKVLPGREYKVPMRVVPTATIFTPAGDGYIATWGNDTAFTVESVYSQQDSIEYVTTNEQTTVGKPIGYGVKLSADL